MRADLRLGQIRSGQMKKNPPRSESDNLKIHISEIITALLNPAWPSSNWTFRIVCVYFFFNVTVHFAATLYRLVGLFGTVHNTVSDS